MIDILLRNVPEEIIKQFGEDFIEVFLRDTKQRCKAIPKIKWEKYLNPENGDVIDKALQLLDKGDIAIENVRKISNSINKSLDNLDSITKNIADSVDTIYKTMSSVQNLQFLKSFYYGFQNYYFLDD